MRVQSLAPLATGLVCFRDPEPRASIVVKHAARIVDGPSPWLALEPQTCELRGPKVAFDGTARPDDFAPRKLRTEVLVVGCAHSLVPSTEVPVELRLGAALHKRAWVRSPAPATLHPLVPAWVMVEPPVSAWFGPRPLPALTVSQPESAREASWSDGWLELPPGDRGESQQCAAVEQQTWERIGPGSPLWLRGFARSAELVSLQLPSEAPWCVLLLRARGGAVEWSELELRLETLHLDATSGLLELGYRGEIDVADFESPPDLVVGLSEGGLAPERADLEPRLARAPRQPVARPSLAPTPSSFARGVAPSSLAPPPPPWAPPAPWAPPRAATEAQREVPPAEQAVERRDGLEEETTSGAEPETIRPVPGSEASPKTLPPDALEPSALPFAVAPLPPPPSLSAAAPPWLPSAPAEPAVTGGLPFVGGAPAPAARPAQPSAGGLPFAGASEASKPLESQGFVDGSGTIAVKPDVADPIPFRRAASAASPPTPPPSADEASLVDGSSTLAVALPRPAALPFQAALGSARVSPASARPTETAGLPFSRRVAPDPAPLPRDPRADPSQPRSAERASDTLPPEASASAPPGAYTLGAFQPPPRMPPGVESPARPHGASFRAPLPTLPIELGLDQVSSGDAFDHQEAATPPAPAVAPALPFSARPASLEPSGASSSAGPRWAVSPVPAQVAPVQLTPSAHAPLAQVARRASGEREVDPASVALVRTLPEDARHDAIRALGYTALAFARAEQRFLEELERELSQGRAERLAQLVSALHERALGSDATAGPLG